MRGTPKTLALCLAFGLAVAPVAAMAADPVSVMADACGGCHGTDGHSVGGMPTLFANAKPGEIKTFLRDFKSGAKEATVMDRIAKGYSVEQLDAIAAYYEARRK